jgi:hypothetical protein
MWPKESSRGVGTGLQPRPASLGHLRAKDGVPLLPGNELLSMDGAHSLPLCTKDVAGTADH